MRSISRRESPLGRWLRRRAAALLAMIWVSGVIGAPALFAAYEVQKALIAKGEYGQAIKQLETIVARNPNDAEALAVLLDARVESGQYDLALREGENWLARRPHTAVAEKGAEAAYRLGEYDRAARLLEPVSTIRADWWKGLLAKTKGQKAQARTAFERVAARLDRNASLLPPDRAVAAAALAELGKFKDANEVFREASKAAPENAEIKAAWGWLFLEKHNPGDAAALFREALEVNPNQTRALLGLAAMSADQWEARAPELLDRALKVNLNLAEARVALARIYLQQDDYDTAADQIKAALRTNPRMLEALSLQAVSEYLKGRSEAVEKEVIPGILAQNPAYGRVFADLGDFAVLKRQYTAAVEFYRRALAADPDLADTRADLGINLFRLGKEEEARALLEEAYRRDPYNIWTINTLRLMDSFGLYDNFETERFRIKLQKKESALLQPYVVGLAEKHMAELTARYGYRTPGKVLLEVYPDHEDFAVRTLGLPGLGALGVSFGPVVAMDSPSARPPGEFHWGSTLWHELTHVITLGTTDNKVPRWFTEGLSVFEETRAHPGWGDPMSGSILAGLRKKSMIPLEKLNAAFVRPEDPTQIQFAYFQSGMVCDFIAEKFGFPKIVAILAAYKNGLSDQAAIQQALGLSFAEFDAQFQAYAKEQTYGFAAAVDLHWADPDKTLEEIQAEVARNPRNFFAQLRLAAALQKQSKLDEALVHAKAAKDLFPVYVDDRSPYQILAEIYESQGQKEMAAAELLEWKKNKGRDPELFLRLAGLLKEVGRTGDAIETLEQLLYISLSNLEAHQKLGEWYMEGGKAREAVREYRSVLALNPPDQAETHYKLALAYGALSDHRSAREQVLAALEIAPGFRQAQKLLLELSAK